MELQLRDFTDSEGAYQATSRTIEAISHCPKSEGVYCLLGEAIGVLYVGTAMNLRYRLRSHFNSQTPWDTAMFREIPYQGELDRGEAEMRLLWEYLPPYNRAYSTNKAFIQMSSFVWEVLMGVYPDVYFGLCLQKCNLPDKRLRSLLWQSGIEIRKHYRIDGQCRNLMGKDDLDRWLLEQVGWSLVDTLEQKHEEYDRRMKDLIAKNNLNRLLDKAPYS